MWPSACFAFWPPEQKRQHKKDNWSHKVEFMEKSLCVKDKAVVIGPLEDAASVLNE